MAIPAIAPYMLPALPDNRLNWTLEADRAVLLIHDMQHYFLRPYEMDASPIADVLSNLLSIRRRCADLGVPVVYTAQSGSQDPADRGLLADLWGPGLTDSKSDTDICAPLMPEPSEILLAKHRYSALVRSPLAGLMRNSGRDQLLIGGVYAHIGIQATAVDAFSNDIKPFVLGDAIAAFNADDHRAALTYMARHCARVEATREVIRTLSGRVAPSLINPLA
ncbi:isochorismatase family protein [Nonomuraea harbinensis]|uniref:Isochorismatase family protein n=1 Tax=Nonomuraea harbinensis TaxID=1286938 RepID=A0ABW1C837_9ACTN|nr:isochorismatase family protein [Nonomuraea harbinensis]